MKFPVMGTKFVIRPGTKWTDGMKSSFRKTIINGAVRQGILLMMWVLADYFHKWFTLLTRIGTPLDIENARYFGQRAA
jgi:hypothetical protein